MMAEMSGDMEEQKRKHKDFSDGEDLEKITSTFSFICSFSTI